RDMVINEQLGTSDFELKNLFQVYFNTSIIGSANSHLGKFGYQFPVVNLESVEKFGLRDLVVSSFLLNIDDVRDSYNKAQKEGTGTTISAETAKKNGLLEYLLKK